MNKILKWTDHATRNGGYERKFSKDFPFGIFGKNSQTAEWKRIDQGKSSVWLFTLLREGMKRNEKRHSEIILKPEDGHIPKTSKNDVTF